MKIMVKKNEERGLDLKSQKYTKWIDFNQHILYYLDFK